MKALHCGNGKFRNFLPFFVLVTLADRQINRQADMTEVIQGESKQTIPLIFVDISTMCANC